MILFGLVESLLGGNLFIAGVLALAGFYLFRSRRYAGTAAAAVGSMTIYAIVVLVSLAGAIALGWLEPNPSLISEGVQAVAEPVVGFGKGIVEGLLKGALEGL